MRVLADRTLLFRLERLQWAEGFEVEQRGSASPRLEHASDIKMSCVGPPEDDAMGQRRWEGGVEGDRSDPSVRGPRLPAIQG